MAAAAEFVKMPVKKKERKIQRKLMKFLTQARKDYEIEISETPTEHLFVANVGVMVGTTAEDIVNVFLPFGPLKEVTMLTGKTFSFISFVDVNASASAYQSLNGKTTEHFKSPCYLTFVTKIPKLNDSFMGARKELPPGLILIKNCISIDKEKELEELIKWNEDDDKALKHRQVKHFGYEFYYDTNNVNVNQPLSEKIPKVCLEVFKVLIDSQQISHIPDQLTVNRYLPGQGIPLHVDTHSAFEDDILSLSIGSPVIMEFKHYDGRHLNVLLPSRSLLIMSKESRYDWKHGISPRKTDVFPNQVGACTSSVFHRGTRVSFTFRKIRTSPCQCLFKQLCDSQTGISSAPKDRQPTENESVNREKSDSFEISHVHLVYDKIADHFSSTRYKPWPKIAEFIETLPIGSLMLDIGCGNGKYLGINSKVFKMGCDRSVKLVSICGERGFESLCSDALVLPFRSSCFDVCICIAVIHHLSTFERRLQSVRELSRVLRPSGKALIYVWAMDQTADGKNSNYIRNRKSESAASVFLNESKDKQPFPIHTNRSYFQHQDLFVPWKLKSDQHNEGESENEKQPQTFYRYYHVFEMGELEALCEQAESLRVSQSYYDKGNWCVLLEKEAASL